MLSSCTLQKAAIDWMILASYLPDSLTRQQHTPPTPVRQ